MDKIVIGNSIVSELDKVPYVEFEKYSKVVPEKEILENPDSEYYLPKLKDSAVFVVGVDAWHKVREMHDKGLIHIGLRHFNFSTVTSMTYVSLSNNLKLVVSLGYINGAPDWSKIEVFRDSTFDSPTPIIENWDIFDLSESQTAVAKLNQFTDKNEYLGFDFETRGFPLREGFKPLGFSIVGRNYGCYIDIRNYTDWQGKEYNLIRKFIEENYKRMVVYNCKFEILVCEHMWGEKLNFPDAMALVLCDDYRLPMRAPKRFVPGLKPAAQHYLHVASWDDSLAFEQLYFGNMCYRFSTPTQFFEHMNRNEEVWLSKSVTSKIRDGLVKVMDDAVERYTTDNNLKEGTEEYISAKKRIKAGYKERILKAWGNEWELSDPYALGKYCIYDSFYTKLIWDYLKGKYPRAEEIYHGNYHYGAFLEDTAIPINRKRLETLINYAETVKANTGVFLVKFYLMCLEDTIGDFVDTKLSLTSYSKKLISEFPWTLSLEPSKTLKEVVKGCMFEEEEYKKKFPGVERDYRVAPVDSVDWERVGELVSREVARGLYQMISGDGTIGSALRKHRNAWEGFGRQFALISKYPDLIIQINSRNLRICKPYFKKFNKEVEDIVSPFDPNICKLITRYFEEKKLQRTPWKVTKDYPEISGANYEFIKQLQKEWDSDYWKQNYLGGRQFKKVMSYIGDSWYEKGGKEYKGAKDEDILLNSYDFIASLPPILLLELPDDELISVKEVVDLIHLRELRPLLNSWDGVKIDGKFPDGVTPQQAKWLSEEVVQWSSDDATRSVAWSMLKKYGWLCSAITQFWNYWWSPDHKGQEEHDPEVLDYAIKSALEDKEKWYIDFQEYFYGASKQVKKDERAVDVAGFCRRFGFERPEVRQWDWFNLTKDSTMSLEEGEDKLHTDWRNLYKMIICWELYSASTKQLNPYLTRMNEDSGQVVGLTRDNCEIIREGVKGDKFLTKFQICGVTTKRKLNCA